MNQSRKFITILVIVSALAACVPAVPPAHVPRAPTQPQAEPLVCNTDYTRHELTAPYQQDKYDPKPRYTFTPAEFSTALAELDITSACTPEGADAPYLVFDWDVEEGTASQGSMVIFSFDAWREAQIVFSTYDFAKPTKYERFASVSDYEAIRNSSERGFERITTGPCYGTCTVYKTFIYPFADHYVAVTLNVGAYEAGKAVEAQVLKFVAGEYPAEMGQDLARFDMLVRGLEFAQP